MPRGKVDQNIQGRALPILVWVRSMRLPKRMSVTPSRSLVISIRVPITAPFIPIWVVI